MILIIRLKIFRKNLFIIKKISLTLFNLAAQAGVRYSIHHEYVDTNILGFYNVIENSKNIKLKDYSMHHQVLCMEKFKILEIDINKKKKLDY